MFIASPDQDSDPALAELKSFSDRISQKVGRRSPRVQGEASHLSTANWSDSNSAHSTLHAAPLMPLRKRDMKVMAEMFEQDRIEEMEADVVAHLAKLCPEPCWEDEPFDFLQDYL